MLQPSPPGHEARPQLSVVVSTRLAWPGVAPALDALVEQAVAARAEVLVVDGGGHAFDEEPSLPVRWVRAPGRDVFDLRAIGVAAARGDIVAITEDHCVVADDYCDALLRAHAEHAEPVVAGAVVNGSAERLMDRTNFVLVHGSNLPPRGSLPPGPWTPSPANTSYKRAVLPAGLPARGWLELVLHPASLQAHDVAFDDRIVVSHVQCTGRVGTFVNHFRAGRVMGALARKYPPPGTPGKRWLARATIGLSPALLRRVGRLGRERPEYRREVSRVLPAAIGLTACATAGFAIGALRGPGRSGLRLH